MLVGKVFYNNSDSQVYVKVTEATRKLREEMLIQVSFSLSCGRLEGWALETEKPLIHESEKQTLV